MDPRARLDYALFQLTPTRTRCDLVIFAGGESEKLASGIFQPFVSHLKSVRDQISKGGYSVTLRPSSAAAPPWFTKATLQRFVRFVSTPEVLERFVTLEKEIEQIEDSIQSNGAIIAGESEVSIGNESAWNSHKSTALSMTKGESEEDNLEEHSKVRLQRVLENRKAVLCKEQAMAYARALVVGFEFDSMDNLLTFADTFGASRLREACMNFMELCKRKNEDRLWVDQIAAMQVFPRPELSLMENSGIVLAGEENNDTINLDNVKNSSSSMDGMSQDGKAQMPWLNPHYMQNFPYQSVHPYHGYMFPGPPPPYTHWPMNTEDSEPSDNDKFRKSSKKKKKKKKNKQDESSEASDSSAESESEEKKSSKKKKKKNKKKKQDESSEPSDSSAGSESEGKKSSKKVVIRNINYIASKRNDSDAETYFDGDSIKQQVEEAVGSIEKKHRRTSRRKHERDDSRDDDRSEKTKGNDGNWDAFQNLLLKDRDSDTLESNPLHAQEESLLASTSPLNMESEVRKKQLFSDDSLLVIDGNVAEAADGETGVESFEGGGNVRPIRRQDVSEEMLFPQRSGDFSSLVKTFVSDQFPARKSERDVLTDDSFMIQSREDNRSEYSRPRTDIMVSDIQHREDDTQEIPKVGPTHEPDDLYMVLGREPDVENVTASWTPEIEYESPVVVKKASVKNEEAGTKASDGKAKKNGAARAKLTSKDVKSRALNRSDPASKAKRPPWGSRAPVPNKTKSELEEEKRKRTEELVILRQKRIAERSGGSLGSKKDQTMIKPSKKDDKTKTKSVLRSSTIDRLAVARTVPKAPQRKPEAKRTNTASKPMAKKTDKTRLGADDGNENLGDLRANALPAPVDDFKDIKELHSVSSIETVKGNMGSNGNVSDEKLVNEQSKSGTQLIGDRETEKSSVPVCEDKQINRNNPSEDVAGAKFPMPTKLVSPKKSVTFSETNMEEMYFLSPRVSEINKFSTPPPPPASDDVHSDSSRKKWNNGEDTSPKATTKVFRKLLMFGRKSRS